LNTVVKKKMLAVLISVPLLMAADSLPAAEQTVIVSVPGIPGPYCAYGVEKRLYELASVKEVVLLWEREQIQVSIKDGQSVTPEQILAAFKNSEYPYDYTILSP